MEGRGLAQKGVVREQWVSDPRIMATIGAEFFKCHATKAI